MMSRVAAFLDGYNSSPVLLHKGISKNSNNFTGELTAIELALLFLKETDVIINRTIHMFTDCQPAIITAFITELPRSKIDTVISIRNAVDELKTKGSKLEVHWVPGHRNIKGNDLADSEAKKGAEEIKEAPTDENVKKDHKEIVDAMKKKIAEKWNNRFTLSEDTENIDEFVTTVGKRKCIGEKDRKGFSVINQLITGHTRLNSHQAKIKARDIDICDSCKVPETTEHYLFDCDKFSQEREKLQREVEEVLYLENLTINNIDLKVLLGIIDNISKSGETKLIIALLAFIHETSRF